MNGQLLRPARKLHALPAQGGKDWFIDGGNLLDLQYIYIYQYMSYEICLCIFAMYCQQNLAFLLRIGRFFFGGETQEKYSYRVSFMDGTVLWSQSLGENSRDSQKARVEERAK